MRRLPLPRGAPVVVVGVVLRTAAAFAFTKLTAAWLGPNEFARYGHYLLLTSYLLTASCFGLSNSFTVYIAKRSGAGARTSADLRPDVHSVVLLGVACGGLVAAALAVLVGTQWAQGFLPPLGGVRLVGWCVFCVCAGGSAAYLATLLAEERHRAYQAMATAMPLVGCAIWFGSRAAGSSSAEVAIAAYMSGFVVPLIVFLVGGRATFHVNSAALRSAVRFVTPYVLPSLLIPTIGALGILAVRKSVSVSVTAEALGLWQALWRLSEAYMGVLITIGSALFVPRLSRAVSRSQAYREVWRASLASLLLYLPVAACWVLVPRWTIRMLLSPGFLGIEPLLPLQVIGDVFKVLCAILILTHAALLRPGITLIAEVLFSTAFVGLTVLLTRTLGARGAVEAYACAYVCLFVTLLPLAWRTIRTLPVNGALQTCVASGEGQIAA